MTPYNHSMTVCLKPFGEDLDLQVDYNLTEGRPEQGPTYSSGGEPAEGPEVEFGNVKVLTNDNAVYFNPSAWFINLATDTIINYILENHEESEEEDRADYEYDKAKDEYDELRGTLDYVNDLD